MRNEMAYIGRFKICPSRDCGVLNEPLARFCRECQANVQSVSLTPYTQLPEARTLPNGKSTHFVLSGLSPAEFYHGALALLEGRALSVKQQPAKRALEVHILNIRKITNSN